MKIKKGRALGGIILLTLGLLSLSWGFQYYPKRDKQLFPEQLKLLNIKVKSVAVSFGKTQYVYIEAEDYSNIDFGIQGIHYMAANVKAISENILVGDNIEIEVLEKTYCDEMIEAMNHSVSQENNVYVSLYGLKKNNRAYLTLENINKAQKRDSTFGMYLFAFVGFVVISLGIRKIYNSLLI